MQTSEKRRRFSCLSDIGTARKNNEDAAYAASSQFGALLIVADGMGGSLQSGILLGVSFPALFVVCMLVMTMIGKRKDKNKTIAE